MSYDQHNEQVETVEINESELMKLALESALQVEGVSAISDSENPVKYIPGFSPVVKGARLSTDDRGIVLDLYVRAWFRTRIPKLAWDIQEKVSETLQEKYGIKPAEINVHVNGVDRLKEDR